MGKDVTASVKCLLNELFDDALMIESLLWTARQPLEEQTDLTVSPGEAVARVAQVLKAAERQTARVALFLDRLETALTASPSPERLEALLQEIRELKGGTAAAA